MRAPLTHERHQLVALAVGQSSSMGWSPSTALRMAKRYGHIGHTARREAIDKLASVAPLDLEDAQKWAQWQDQEPKGVQ